MKLKQKIHNKTMKIFILFTCMVFILSACSNATDKDYEEFKQTFFAMDTFITLTAYGKNADAVLKEAENKMAELESLWSVTDEKSEVFTINHSKGNAVEISNVTADLLAFALQMASQTDGALDPTIYPVVDAWGFTGEENRIPESHELARLLGRVGYDKVKLNGNKVIVPDGTEVDFGAVGKGYAGDILSGLLMDAGIRSSLIDLGGNIQAVGSKPDGSDWKIGIRNPLGDGNLGVLSVSDRAVVTSGSYERYFVGEDGKEYGHIIDPETGYPAESGLLSVTVIAKQGKLCDALSTSLFVMGLDKAMDYWNQYQDFDMILVTEQQEIYLTEGIQSQIELDGAWSSNGIHVIKTGK